MFRPLTFYIGLRYTRAKRRNHFISFISLISMLGIVLGVTALITVLSVMNGFEKEVRSRILGMAAHATISGAYGSPLQNWSDVAEIARHDAHVVGEAPYIQKEGMLIAGQRVNGAIIRGVLPDQEPKVSDVAAKMVQGNLADLKVGEFGIILGVDLARLLGVTVGDKVMVVTPVANVTPAGVLPRLKRFTVKGIFDVGMYEYDSGLAVIDLNDAQVLFRMPELVTGLRLKLDDMFRAPWVARDLAGQLPGLYHVTDWTQQHANYFRAVQTEKRMMFIILTLIVAVAAFNIVSTLVMVVTDKQTDIAILRTLGLSPRGVMGIFMVQGTLIGLIGTILGVIGGVALALNVETIVSGIEHLFGIRFIPADIYYISELPSDLHWDDVATIGIVSFLLSVVATLYPAWRAARTQPAEALRYE